MKAKHLAAILAALMAATASSQTRTLPGMGYIENKGQWDGRAQFLAQAGGSNVWVTQEGVVFDFRTSTQNAVKGHVVRMSFANAQPAGMAPAVELKGKLNYFVGSDSAHWASNVRRFGEVKAEEIYPGIAARYYFDHGLPRYDLVVQPGADPEQISMQFEGQDGLSVLPNGNLCIRTSLGSVEEQGLNVYQAQGVKRLTIPSRMAVSGNAVRFKLGDFDRAKPLVIDPLIFSTFLGGTATSTGGGNAFIYDVLDKDENIIAVGESAKNDFPVTTGAYQRNLKGSDNCVAVKLTSDGQTLLFGTFLGGSGGDSSVSVKLDSVGNLVLAGTTSSNDFPTTPGAFMRGLQRQDAFVSKISGDGSQLIFSTLLGGSSLDSASALALDSNDNPVVCGFTYSSDFPTTANAFQTRDREQSINWAVFVSRLSADGTTLLASTYLSGSGSLESNGDWPEDLILDSSGNPIVCGITSSRDFPVTTGTFQTQNVALTYAAFVVKLSADETTLILGTYLAGPGGSVQEATALALDHLGNIVVGGITNAPDFPTTAGAFQRTYGGWRNDMFVAKLTPDFKTLVTSTYLGGSDTDNLYRLVLDKEENIVLVGGSGSSDFPTTPGAYQTWIGFVEYEYAAVIAKLSSDGSHLLYGSYLGQPGNGDYFEGPIDGAYGLGLDSAGNAIVAGKTSRADFPITPGALQSTPSNSYILKLSFAPSQSIVASLDVPQMYFGGPGVTATVHLRAAQAQPTTLTVFEPTGSVLLPANVMVPVGSVTADFTIVPNPAKSRGGDYTIHVQGPDIAETNTGLLKTVRITGLMSRLEVDSWINSGESSNGSVYLDGAVQSGGIVVDLSSNDSRVQVPDTLLVNSTDNDQNTYGAFNYTTTVVDETVIVTLTAKYGIRTISQQLELLPMPDDPVVAVDVPLIYYGGPAVTGTLRLKNIATRDYSFTVVALSGTEPSTVVVKAGSQSQDFTVVPIQAGGPTDAIEVAAYYKGSIAFERGLTIYGSIDRVETYHPNIIGGQSSIGFLYLKGLVQPGGTMVGLSSDTAALQVPASAPIQYPALDLRNSYGIYRFRTTGVDSSTAATITATLGSIGVHTTITIWPATVASVKAFATVVGGYQTSGTVFLNGQAGPSGVQVALISDNPAVRVAAMPLVAAGQSQVAFRLTTSPVTSATVVNLTATYKGTSVKTTITVLPKS